MRKIAMLALLLASMLAHAGNPATPELGRYVKAYNGPEGTTVRILRIGPHASGEALVQVTGIDHGWDGRMMKMKIEATQQGYKYVFASGGKTYDILDFSDSDGLTLLVPGMRRRAMLQYALDKSSASIPQHMLTEYQEQNGTP